MANAIKWEAAWNSRSTVLTTELDSLSNGSLSAAGTAVNNGSNLDQYGILELAVTFGSAPSAGGYVSVYRIQAPNGTDYQSAADVVQLEFVCAIPVDDSTSAQRLVSPMIQMPPAPMKFLLENKSGQAFPSSGSTLSLYTTNDEVQ